MGKRIPVSTRLAAKVTKTDAGCWEWTGAIDKTSGYGRINVDRKIKYAHRVSYETNVGPIPDGLTIDHLCRNRRCINPAHLDPVPIRVNVLRAPNTVASRNAAKTSCPQGHPYDAANTYITPQGQRTCRICRRARLAAWHTRHAA